MILLILFAFLAGIVTILSPCILPILPIILSGSVGSGKRKPFGIVFGFIISFTFFTLFLSAIVKATGLSPDVLRSVSVFIIAIFGVSLLIPKLQLFMERQFSQLAGYVSSGKIRDGFMGGILIGLSLGLIWTPCVGPILAAVITLAVTSSVNFTTLLITLAYAIGTAIPMFLVMYGGRNLLVRIPGLLSNTQKIQKAFGVLMILTAVGIHFNVDRKFQTYILNKFPTYGVGLTKFEDNPLVANQLNNLRDKRDMDLFGAGNESAAPELIQGGQWFNSKPLTLKTLRGKVVLLDFWTYTCINCIRTLPYLKSWHEKYKDKGLVIIGIHSPEFEFEKNPDNVLKAIKDFGLTYPIMQDNNFDTWRAYNNKYWPAKYFIDKDGKIRSAHFGEGDNDESEKKIQKLLAEIGQDVTSMPVNNPTYQLYAQTPETYVGSNRFTPRSMIFSGNWLDSGEYRLAPKGGTLKLNFNAKEVFLVARPKQSGVQGTFTVQLEGENIPSNYLGKDAESNTNVVKVNSDRLYKLINLNSPGEFTLILNFNDDNLELFAFTFG